MATQKKETSSTYPVDLFGLTVDKEIKIEGKNLTLTYRRGIHEISDTITVSKELSIYNGVLAYPLSDVDQITQFTENLLLKLWDDSLAQYAREMHHTYIASERIEDPKDPASYSQSFGFNFHDKQWIVRISKNGVGFEQNVPNASAPSFKYRHGKDLSLLLNVERDLQDALVAKGALEYGLYNRMEKEPWRCHNKIKDWEILYNEDFTNNRQHPYELTLSYSETLKRYRLSGKNPQTKHAIHFLVTPYARRDIPNEYAGDDMLDIIETGKHYLCKELDEKAKKKGNVLRRLLSPRP